MFLHLHLPAARRLQRLLGTNRDEFSRLDFAESLQDRRHEWAKFLHTIRSGDKEYETEARGPEILLEWQALIDGQETLEPRSDHQRQEFAVSFRRPPFIDDVVHVVGAKFTEEWSRNTLIEQ